MTICIEKSIWIAASPEAVFDAYCSPDSALRWLGAQLTIAPRLGGPYVVDMGTMGVVDGTIRKIERPHVLHHTSGDVGEAPGSLVQLSLAEEAGGTRLMLRHDGVAEEGAERIWDHHLARLAIVAGGGMPGPDFAQLGWSEEAVGLGYFTSWLEVCEDEA